MSSTKQLKLPWKLNESQFEPISRVAETKRWYYVVKVLTDEMLAMDDMGNYVFVPHDTVRLTPHLFGSKRLAQQVSCQMKYTAVDVWRWQLRG